MKKNLINSKELITFLDNWINYDNYLLNKPIIPFIHGKAGIGKTQIVEEIAKKYNKKLIILNLSHQEEGDLIGIPKIVDNKTIWTKPEWMIDEENVILFLDEIDRAPKNILNAILTLLREYRIHTHYLSPKWKIIAAGNSGFNDDFYDIQELDNALSSRFIHLFYEINTNEWLKWAINNNFNEIIIKYLKTKPEHLIVENTKTFNFAYPNPRTWEYLNESLKIFNTKNINDNLLLSIIKGTIGDEIGQDFFIFYKTHYSLDFATFEEIYNDFNIFKKRNKTFYTNTILNININNILENDSFDIKKIADTFTKIIIYLGNKKYYELAYLLTNKIETESQELIKLIITKINKNIKYKEIFQKIKKEIEN